MGRLFFSDNVQSAKYEVDPNNSFAVLNGPVADGLAHTMGGMMNRIFSGVGNIVNENNPDTLAIIGTVNTANSFFGIGGTATDMYYVRQNTNQIYRFNPDTGADIGSPGSTPAGSTDGVGGNDLRLWITNSFGTNRGYEYDPIALINLSGPGVVLPGDGDPTDIAGFDDRLFLLDRQQPNPKLFELDPNSMISISGPGDPVPGGTGLGLGGMKEVPFPPSLNEATIEEAQRRRGLYLFDSSPRNEVSQDIQIKSFGDRVVSAPLLDGNERTYPILLTDYGDR